MFTLSTSEVELVVSRAVVILTLECFFDDVLGLYVESEGLLSICPGSRSKGGWKSNDDPPCDQAFRCNFLGDPEDFSVEFPSVNGDRRSNVDSEGVGGVPNAGGGFFCQVPSGYD